MRTKVLALLAALCCLAVVLVPAQADAQGHRPHRGPSSFVSYGGMWGGGFFYNPWFYGAYQYYPPYPYYPYYGARAASIRIEVEPRNADVYLDGRLVGTVDQFDGYFSRLDVRPGAHRLTVYLKGYHSFTRELSLRAGASIRVKGKLEPLAPSEPEEPRPAPMVAARPAPGDEPEGRIGDTPEPMDQPRPGEGMPVPRPPDRIGRMPRPPVAMRAVGYGQLALRWQPADASVIVDGEPWQASGPGERLVLQLPAGTHRIEIRKDGYAPYSTEVEVRADDTTVLNVSLTERR